MKRTLKIQIVIDCETESAPAAAGSAAHHAEYARRAVAELLAAESEFWQTEIRPFDITLASAWEIRA